MHPASAPHSVFKMEIAPETHWDFYHLAAPAGASQYAPAPDSRAPLEGWPDD